jgi:autotransporter-associated beta strand protein/T5SS/PEP-CTERM-associated repeat protein
MRSLRLLCTISPLMVVACSTSFSDAAITVAGNLSGAGTPYNGTDDPWSTVGLVVGDTATGSVAISAGSVVHDTSTTTGIVIANSAAAVGSQVSVDGVGSALTVDNQLSIGDSGSGSLSITGGGTVIDKFSGVGIRAGGNGTVTVSDGIGNNTWSNTILQVGGHGAGRVDILGGGGVSVEGETDIGALNDGSGSVNVGGGVGSATLSLGTLYVGATGALKIAGGGSVSNTGIAEIGIATGGAGTLTGTATIDGSSGAASWTSSSQLLVGYNGYALLNIVGGGTATFDSVEMTRYGTSHGTVTIGGGGGSSTWNVLGSLSVGTLGTAIVNINAGGQVNAASLEGGNSTSSINLNGGTLSITTTDSASNAIKLLAGNGAIHTPTANQTLTVTSGISGVGGFTKTGVGTLLLTAANIYTGDTSVSGGALTISGAGSIPNTRHINVNSGGTLDTTGVNGGLNFDSAASLAMLRPIQTLNVFGGGSVSSAGFEVNGTANVGGGAGVAKWALSNSLSLGNQNPGKLNITDNGSVSVGGNYAQSATSTLSFVLGDAIAHGDHAPLAISGTATLAGMLEIEPVAGFVPVVGEEFDVLTAKGGISGSFSAISLQNDSGLTLGFTTVYDANKVSIVIGSIALALPGDYNNDGVVDLSDYVTWQAHLGQTYVLPNRDLSASGPIGQGDYDFWRAHFGSFGFGAALGSGTVPEPTGIWLAIVGMGLLSRNRAFAR